MTSELSPRRPGFQNMSRRDWLKYVGLLSLVATGRLATPPLVKAAELKEGETGPLAPVVVKGNPNKMQVAITVDDAWSRKMVERFLEISGEYGFKATLFPVGRVMGSSSTLWKEAVDKGHEIGCHTYSHPWLTKLSDEQVREEVENWKKVAGKIGIPETNWIRPPYGAGFIPPPWDPRLRRILGELGLAVALWSIDSGSTQGYPDITAKEIVNNVITNLHPGAIILFHFLPQDMEALPVIVEEVKRQGYELVTLSEMFPDIVSGIRLNGRKEEESYSRGPQLTRRDFFKSIGRGAVRIF